ncbi:MAG TPA: methionyl-tRNA formyltransferase [Acidimicrobiales bacterium]|nr:methionyl-tRNA formyltransferase [Acidimicrobiales bacterium]
MPDDRLVFLGSPAAAVPTLETLVDAGHDVVLVVSQSDKRRGRGGQSFAPSPVKKRALELDLEVTDRLDDVLSTGAGMGVVVAYGRIIPQRVLDAVPMINVHFSLLPRWRGAAPVERAILAGDEETGVCVMRLEAGLDTGPVLGCESTAIKRNETAVELTDRLAKIGAKLTAELLSKGVDALPPGHAQSGEPTYAAKIDPSELRLDFSRSADELERFVRTGRAWTTWRGSRLRVLSSKDEGHATEGHATEGRATEDRATEDRATEGRATESRATESRATEDHVTDGHETEEPWETQRESKNLGPGVLEGDLVGTADGALRLLEVQPEGKRPMKAIDWLRGLHPLPGERLGD